MAIRSSHCKLRIRSRIHKSGGLSDRHQHGDDGDVDDENNKDDNDDDTTRNTFMLPDDGEKNDDDTNSLVSFISDGSISYNPGLASLTKCRLSMKPEDFWIG